MAETAPPDDPLQALFSGNRRWIRIPCARDAWLVGPEKRYGGAVLDISEGGVLFAVDDEEFYEGGADGLLLVQRAFPDGPVVEFEAEGIRISAAIVRITPHRETRLALGCRFDRPITDSEAVLLGVFSTRVDHAEAMAASLLHVARPDKPVSLLVFAEAEEAAGPLCVAPVRAVGERAMIAEVSAGAVRTIETLAGRLLRTRLVLGREPLWEGGSHLIDCRVPKHGLANLFRFFANEDLGRRVHRRFQRTRG